LSCGDALKESLNYIRVSFDYVCGNPPYVRTHNLSTETREYLKDRNNLSFGTGTTDLYVAFYDIGLRMLKDTGVLGYISPNSFLKNTSQKAFRNYLIENEYLSAVYDFKSSKIFEDADTYTCICILNKDRARHEKTVQYREYRMYDVIGENTMSYDYFISVLKDRPWVISSKKDFSFLEHINSLPMKIGKFTVIQNGIATNLDEVYVGHAYRSEVCILPYTGKDTDPSRTVYFKTLDGTVHPVESSILRRCVKASRYSGELDQPDTSYNLYMLFPYTRKTVLGDNGYGAGEGVSPMWEEALRIEFPLAYQYLLSRREKLEKRDMEKDVSWFLFGRSQGMLNSGYRKIVFKHVISKESPAVIPHILDEDVVVYSGMYLNIQRRLCVIAPPNGKFVAPTQLTIDETVYDELLEEIRKAMATDDFARYCALTGKDMAGGFVSVSTKTVKQYGFESVEIEKVLCRKV
jgi:adenine-specific DNA-methyltransferase